MTLATQRKLSRILRVYEGALYERYFWMDSDETDSLEFAAKQKYGKDAGKFSVLFAAYGYDKRYAANAKQEDPLRAARKKARVAIREKKHPWIAEMREKHDQELLDAFPF